MARKRKTEFDFRVTIDAQDKQNAPMYRLTIDAVDPKALTVLLKRWDKHKDEVEEELEQWKRERDEQEVPE